MQLLTLSWRSLQWNTEFAQIVVMSANQFRNAQPAFLSTRLYGWPLPALHYLQDFFHCCWSLWHGLLSISLNTAQWNARSAKIWTWWARKAPKVKKLCIISKTRPKRLKRIEYPPLCGPGKDSGAALSEISIILFQIKTLILLVKVFIWALLHAHKRQTWEDSESM